LLFALHFCRFDQKYNTVIKAVLYTADVLLELGQEVCGEGLSGTGKANTHMSDSLCPQGDSNTLPWKPGELHQHQIPGIKSVMFAVLGNFMYPYVYIKA
jgi:hypothetical protein